MEHVSSAAFDDEVLGAPVPVVLEFSATWCGPCKQLAPTLELLSAEYGSGVRFLMVDIDSEPSLAERYGVQGVPQVFFISGGQVKDRVVGVRSAAQLRGCIDPLLGVPVVAVPEAAGPFEDVLAQLRSLTAEQWATVAARVVPWVERNGAAPVPSPGAGPPIEAGQRIAEQAPGDGASISLRVAAVHLLFAQLDAGQAPDVFEGIIDSRHGPG
jgi:thioredoxin 1